MTCKKRWYFLSAHIKIDCHLVSSRIEISKMKVNKKIAMNTRSLRTKPMNDEDECALKYPKKVENC